MQKQHTSGSKLADLLRFGVYLIALVVPLVIFREFLSPFHYGKVIVFRSLLEIMGAMYLVLVLKNRSFLPQRDRIFWGLGIFTLVFALTTATSVLQYPSLWGSLERMGGLWTFLHYFLFFVIARAVLTKDEHWQRVLDITIVAGVLSAFYGFGQKTDSDLFLGSGGRERIFGTMGNAALFAGYELFVVFLSLMQYLRPGNSSRRKAFYAGAFLISSIALMMTVVRGSVLGYGVGLVTFAFLWMRHARARFGKIAFKALLAGIVIFVAFSVLFRDSSLVKRSRYLSRITDLRLSSPTVMTRFWAWQVGIKGWVESPRTMAVGWGPENFNIPFAKYFNPKFYAGIGSETHFDRAHNMFVEILVTMGIVGLLAYLNIFVALFSSLRKLSQERSLMISGIGLTAALVAYIIHNSFIFDTAANLVAFFIVAGYIAHISSSQSERVFSTAPIIRNKILMGLIITGLVVSVPILVYRTNIVPSKANYATTRAIVAGWAKDVPGAFEKYQEALSYDVPGKYEYRHRFAQYLVGDGGPSVREQSVRDAYIYLLGEIDKNIQENPIDHLPHLYASRLNILLGKDDPKSPHNDLALEHSKKALELSPAFIRTYYEVAQAYLNKKDSKNAIKFFQLAVDLNPDAGVSYGYLGAAKIDSGDMSGIQDLEKALASKYPYSPRETDYQILLNAYIKTNDYSRIAWIFEILIERNPNNPQYYASLAAAYANLGRIEDAARMARMAVKVDPSFEPDARAFLKSIGKEL
ncbi:MAG: hypothetical protein A3C88_02535 [Candidatus Yanofskybacteria bacterium RIFCSPHIGHO2_02_FULL_50_12]|uniref:O-antigen ligase-related domain-containing protein n=1 Tax=Candidatus Yanofskybacteria bacterium RIFCSPHIGHO2_02_FULL_50_12 TaxID=1802685 RepID=A0A1F8FU60_9BACT|nr:MAG: hypothetical protein A3C88_02535 [Candidatus Yanofskybacteria bacterium RIFCSPHIGHO2_02_FULL_50_12]